MHRLVAAYHAGKTAYPNEPNPHTDDWPAARMWRLGWQQANRQQHGTMTNTELDEDDQC